MFISNERDNKLKSAFELYNQRMIESLPTDEELSKISFSETFERKMKKLFSLQKKTYYKLINTVGKRVAIIVLALIISLTATTFSVKALREAVIEFITETYEKFTKVSIHTTGSNEDNVIKTVPQYIPQGYEIEFEIDDGHLYSITYTDKENNHIIYDQQIQSGTTYHANTEDIEFETIHINSLEGISYVKNEYNTVVFADENHFYTITGKVSMEEIVKIAESIEIN